MIEKKEDMMTQPCGSGDTEAVMRAEVSRLQTLLASGAEKIEELKANNWEKDYRYQVERMGQDREAFNVAVRNFQAERDTARREAAEAKERLGECEDALEVMPGWYAGEDADSFCKRLAIWHERTLRAQEAGEDTGGVERTR